MSTTQHVHKFKRLKYKTGGQIFFCTQPDCSVKLNPALALGKRTICWRCGEPFLMNEYALRLVKPHCENCHKSKNGVSLQDFSVDTLTSPPEQTDAPVAVISASSSLAERLRQTINMKIPVEIEEEL